MHSGPPPACWTPPWISTRCWSLPSRSTPEELGEVAEDELGRAELVRFAGDGLQALIEVGADDIHGLVVFLRGDAAGPDLGQLLLNDPVDPVKVGPRPGLDV